MFNSNHKASAFGERKSKQWLIFTLLIGLVIFSPACNGDKMPTEERPNIIIFFTDDQGYGDLSCYGATDFETPHIDQVASNGIRFTDFYVAASVCTPSRAALLTGKYPKQVGLHEAVLFPFSEHGLSPEEVTFPELLKPLGYNTACIGKWHLGHLPAFMPREQGFDFFYGVPYSNDMDGHYYQHNQFQSPPLPVFRNREQVIDGPDQDFLTKMWTEAAVEFIDAHQGDPFFLYLAHNMPHLPWHASAAFQGSSERGLYGDMIQELDWSMGEITKALKKNGLDENTIIIFTSDNGPANWKEKGGTAGPLRGGKATTWEGGMRVPGIISWPGKIPAGVVCHQPVSTMDLLPTLVPLVGGEIPGEINTHARDISALLFEPTKKITADFELLYYARDGSLEAFRQGDWKLHIAKSRGWKKEDGEFPISLYNLKEDIGETTNVAVEYPQIVERLRSRMKALDADM